MAIDVLAEILTNRALSADYNVVGFRAPDLARLAQPGQFVMVKTSPGDDPLLRRPFSIFEILRDAQGQPIGLTILNKRVGVGTGLLYAAKPGDALSILGPLGQPWPLPTDTTTREHWMVAGGVGLAPFVTLAERLARTHQPMRLFYGGRSASDLYYASLFADLGATLVLTTEDGTKGEPGRVTAPLERALVARGTTAVTLYSCGPTPMMRAVAALGAAHQCQTFVSLEQVMGCGMGGCYSCVVPVNDHGPSHFVRSCIEGPVFDASRLIWEGLVH
ncbi:MAG: dihydroorotate dehydrogenase electron transfer subunit [Acidobacteria bacterium]|nr:dihydroorotate dehydrogenase electron transfer subunit [Acidobacteriota bacterium]